MTELAEMTNRAVKAATDKATDKNGPLKDPKKMAIAGIGLAALPVAVEAVAKRVAPKVADLGGQAKDKVSDVASDAASNLGDQAKQAAKGAVASKVPGLSSGDDDDQGEGLLSKLMPGSSSNGDGDEEGRAAPGQGGSGRRMPIQQSIDVAVPVKVAYNRWTLFEDWPEFMHRIESVDQADDTTLSVSMKVWGLTRRFEAEIVEQRPDQRIEWNVSEGLAHTGVVTFHELAPRLTRIEVSLDFEPHGMLEKMGRGMRFAKRAVRADLHRFKAIIELDEEAEGGWRGTIEGGEVKRRTERKSSRSGNSSRSRNGSSGSSSRSSSSRSKSSARS
jgi:uncharacterized membrane protein